MDGTGSQQVGTTELETEKAQAQTRSMHARLLERLLEELGSCPTRDIALSVFVDVIREELQADFVSSWSVNDDGCVGVIGDGVEERDWLEGVMPVRGILKRANEEEETVVEPVGMGSDCPVVGEALAVGSQTCVAIPIEGRQDVARTVAVLAFGLSWELNSIEQGLFELLRKVANTAIHRIDDQMILMEANICSEAQVALFGETTRATSADELVLRAVEIVREKFGWEYGSFWRVDPWSHKLVFASEAGTISDDFKKLTRETTFSPNEGLVGRAWAQKELVFALELAELTDCPRAGSAQAVGIHSGICFPIILDDEVVGVLDFLSSERIHLTKAREVALDSVRTLVSQAFRRAQDLDRQKRAAEQARGLAEMLEEVEEAMGSAEAAKKLLEILTRRFSISVASYWRMRDEGLNLVDVYGDGAEVLRAELGSSLQVDGAIITAFSGHELEVYKDSEINEPSIVRATEKLGLSIHFVVPVIIGSEQHGVITAHGLRGVSYTENDRDGIRSVIELFARSVDRIRKDRKVSRYEPMVEKAPTGLGLCDRKGRFVYINEAGHSLFRDLLAYLPISSQTLIGFDAGELMAEMLDGQELTNPENLPIRGRLQIGPEVMAIVVSALTEANGYFLGPLVSWERITDEVRQEEALAASQEKERRRQEELQRGVTALLDVVNRVENGDLTCTVPDCGGGEIARVAVGLDRILQKLRSSMGVIGDIAQQLETDAGDLTVVAERVSGNARSTLENVNLASDGVGDATGGIQVAARGADELALSVAAVAKHASEASRVGGAAMGVASDAAEKIERLGKSSQQIGVVMRTINMIAEQTKLLALNATIESARAGEAGRGFAVVANEVKNLARETADATQDIAHRIEAIQGDTDEVVDAIGRIREVIESINEMQSSIACAVEQQSATTKEMSGSTDGAAGTLAEVVTHTSGVVGMAEDTVSAANNARSAALGLRQTSNRLASTLAEFNY